MTLVIVNLGYGNVGSVQMAFRRIGIDAILSADPAEIRAAERIVLPGVGAAGFAMQRIETLGLGDILRSFAGPALGICLGMQLLFDGSEEGDVAGLGLIPGRVRALVPSPGIAVPHMGWSRIETADPTIGLNDGEHVYFAHGYACDDGPFTVARTHHGRPIPAVVRRGNWTGAQFHPERSSDAGRRFLEAFLQ